MGDWIQIGIAVAIGMVIFGIGRRAVRLLATPGPGEPDPDAVVEVHREYRCTVCGMRLTVTHAAGEDLAPPRHCREPMEEA